MIWLWVAEGPCRVFRVLGLFEVAGILRVFGLLGVLGVFRVLGVLGALVVGVLDSTWHAVLLISHSPLSASLNGDAIRLLLSFLHVSECATLWPYSAYLYICISVLFTNQLAGAPTDCLPARAPAS